MIQLLTYKDASMHRKQLIKLFYECKKAGAPKPPELDYCSAKIDEMIEYLKAEKAFCFAYLSDERVLGFLWTCRLTAEGEDLMHLLYLAVDDSCRGQGIGSRLMFECDEVAKSLGLKTAELNVKLSNKGATKLYRRLGYEDYSIQDDHLTLRKKLTV